MAENSLPFCFAQEILLIQFKKSCFCFLQSPLILILTFDLNLICLTVVVVFLSL